MLKLALPVVEVERRPSCPEGGVGGGSSSDLPPVEPMVEDRPRLPIRAGGAKDGEDVVERADVVESFRNKLGFAAEETLTADASAECEDGCDGWLLPSVFDRWTAVNGGL